LKKKSAKEIVKKHYSKIASEGKTCCSCNCNEKLNSEQISKAIGYTNQDIQSIPEANLGLGCGNPTAFGKIKEGDVVLDLGSGAGFDSFIASKKVGDTGKVIGVDMTQEMIDKANENAEKYGFKNVEFRYGDIENLPIENETIDIIISNCVINLAPDKLKVFKEAYRVLKKTGKLYVSDIVLLKELTDEQRKNEELIAGCVGGALLKNQYLKIIKEAGFNVKIILENKEISKTQYQGIALESLTVEGVK
jgi:ArsR family transcriptional regulator